MEHLNLTVLVPGIVAVLVNLSKLLTRAAPFWAILPRPWSTILPAFAVLLPQGVDFFVDVNSWTDFTVAVLLFAALVAPGALDAIKKYRAPLVTTLLVLFVFGCGSTPLPPCDYTRVAAVAAECNITVRQLKGPERDALIAECDRRIEEACP